MAHRNRWFTWVYVLNIVIFHGYVSNNQMVILVILTNVGPPNATNHPIHQPWLGVTMNHHYRRFFLPTTVVGDLWYFKVGIPNYYCKLITHLRSKTKNPTFFSLFLAIWSSCQIWDLPNLRDHGERPSNDRYISWFTQTNHEFLDSV